MTTKEYISLLDKRINKLKETDAIGRAVITVVADQAKRIFEDGQGTVNPIGKYNSTKPIYVDPATSPVKFSAKGKTGKPTKYGYFDSYKDFRNTIGRQTSFVDLKLTGILGSDFRNGVVKINSLRWKRIFRNPVNKDKAKGNQERFGLIWKATDKERAKFKEIARKEITKILQGG